MKKAIVTGANGFLGIALCKELVSQNIEVIAIVKDENENISEIVDLKGLKIIYCDLSEIESLYELVSDDDIDVMFHFAWIGSVGDLRGDSNIQTLNIKYTCNAVKACYKLNCKRFIFASSIMEYEIQAIMNTEISPGINTLYSSAKVGANYMARALSCSLGIDYIRTVISNIYGPGEKNTRLINSTLRKMLNNEKCSFSSGEQMYDFIYITDAAKAFVAVAKKGFSNRTYYIGSCCPKPLKKFLIELRDQVAPKLEIGLGEIPFNGISLSYEEFDINAVKRDTGFEPTVSFEEGIKNTFKWIKENI